MQAAYETLKILELLGESEFPSAYRLDRSSYRLDLRIESDRFLPHVWIESSTPSGESLLVKPRSDRLARAGRPRPCGTYSGSEPTEKLRFDWVICGPDAGAAEMTIAFDIVDGNNTTLGNEDLPFEFVTNGLYLPPDSL